MDPRLIFAGVVVLGLSGVVAIGFTDVGPYSFVETDGDCTWRTFEGPNGQPFSSKDEVFTAYEQATGNSSDVLQEQVDFRVQNDVVEYRSCPVEASD